MRATRRRSLVALMVGALAIPVIATTAPTAHASGPPNGLTGTTVAPTGRITVAKSKSGKLAQTDPALLGRTDATTVPVLVKLDYDATASYTGDVAGLAATSPSVTGAAAHRLDRRRRRPTTSYTDRLEASFAGSPRAGRSPGRGRLSLQRVYGGVAVQVPANQVAQGPGDPRRRRGAAGHARAAAHRLQPEFIGAPTI